MRLFLRVLGSKMLKRLLIRIAERLVRRSKTKHDDRFLEGIKEVMKQYD